jgi:DNA-3-methyladenine glycosylase II
MPTHAFRIASRGPFSWPFAFSVLERFPPLAHVWRGTERDVKLSLLSDESFARVDVHLRFAGDALHGLVSDASLTERVERQVARIFSLDHDGTGWPSGKRPVCFTSPYEAACWAIVSQRIGKQQAAHIFAALAEMHRGYFPTPRELLDLRSLRGLATVKIDRLHGVARAALEGQLDAERLRALGDDEAPAHLRRISGIGPFWSSGIYLRACGVPDVFPDEPLAIAALARVFRLGPSPSAEAIRQVTDRFRPFRMWACFLLRVADARGSIRRLDEAELTPEPVSDQVLGGRRSRARVARVLHL